MSDPNLHHFGGTEESVMGKKPEHELAPVLGSVEGFWRSARGENHGLNSKPGDEWVTAGTATDTDRLRWLVENADELFFGDLPEDFGQARQYIDNMMMNPPNERTEP